MLSADDRNDCLNLLFAKTLQSFMNREVQKVVAELVASEFFQQGDIEKAQLKIEPIVSSCTIP